MLALSFMVHGAPVPKARARVMAAGYSFTPKRVRDYEKLVRERAKEAVAAVPGWPKEHEAGYRVRIAVYREARRGDLDNLLKSVTDAIQGGVVMDDDRRILDLHGLMFVDKADPRVLVEVVPLEASP